MIKVTQLNGTPYFINDEKIESMVAMPDTIIYMTNGNKLVVCESPEQVIDRIVEFRQRVWRDPSLRIKSIQE